MENFVGKTLGNYQIVSEIGRGGMAIVYKAFQSSLNRSVAIKIVAPSLEQDTEFFKRFRQEALSTAALEHPNIIHVYDTGEEQGLPYIVMEYISGGNLFTRLKSAGAPLPIAEAATLTAQIAIALDFAHRHGIVHRDVKPSNILLDSEGRAVLSDLGIARALEATRLTRTGITMGTPDYMSPEQAEGKPTDGRADLYSLGIVLYEILTGRLPYQADKPIAILYKHIHEPLPDPRKINPKISKKLNELITKALAKDPSKRFQSGQEMATALFTAIPESRLQIATPAATVPRIERTPKEIALTTLDAARGLGVRTLKALGFFLWRLSLRVLEAVLMLVLVLAIVGVLLSIALSFTLAQYAEATLRETRWEYSLFSPVRPYPMTTSEFAQYSAPYLEQHTFGTIRNAAILFTSPDRMSLSAKVLGSSLVLDGTISTSNGVPQMQLQHLNNMPLPFVGDIISNGINQGFIESWANSPVKVTRLVVVNNTTLSVETVNK